LSSTAALSRGLIFTHYQVQVIETLKGHAEGVIDVAVPGGEAVVPFVGTGQSSCR
jgi:hypothetical protein